MDFGKNLSLKENYAFFVTDDTGQVPAGRTPSANASTISADDSGAGSGAGSEHGLYHGDTRFLSRYLWRTEPGLQTLLLHSPRPDTLLQHQALLGHHQQHLAVHRELRLYGSGFVDSLTVAVTGNETMELQLELTFDADFADLFEVRGWGDQAREVEHSLTANGVRFAYRAADGLLQHTDIRLPLDVARRPASLTAGRAEFRLRLEPGERHSITVEVRISNPLDLEHAPAASAGPGHPRPPAPSYEEWREQFTDLVAARDGGRLSGAQQVAARAIDDLRALLLFTADGPVPAAGIPWYVAAFGRDALLSAALLLPLVPEVAVATLRYLARYQGRTRRGFTAEAPGKIMHELRFGEMTRTGRGPPAPYYGTVDATPLFVVLLGRLHQTGGASELVRGLRPQWEAALDWMVGEADEDGDGFLEFTPAEPGQGLSVQSWKDSEDSMSHADGSLAPGRLAVSEVQGYAYEAYRSAAGFYRELGEPESARSWRQRAERLQKAFHEAFWLPELGTYALALYGAKKPLAVHNSDAGHLLWSGIVPADNATRLVSTLFAEENWSGWGFRTLGSSEVRYNPVSYHNGSVWPHDSALVAAGLARYGFTREALRVREALIDLALSQNDLRLPELVAGYERVSTASSWRSEPPIPYPVACRPQAWDAAALVFLLRLGRQA